MIFQGNPDINKTAYLNWRTDKHDPINNFVVIADGYSTGALQLIDDCLENNVDKKADVLIFPILFSINQAVELYLKSIQWSLNILLGKDEKFSKGHDIRQLWQMVNGLVSQFEVDGERIKQFNGITKNLDVYIQELYSKIDPDGEAKGIKNIDFSRYPMNNDKQSHFYIIMKENCTVDLVELKAFWSDISNTLECIAEDYEEKAMYTEGA